MKIPDFEAYKLLKKYQIPVTALFLAKSLESTKLAAEQLGYPVVLKIDAEIIHKRQAGCVRIINKKDDLTEAYQNIMLVAKSLTTKINGVIVQSHMTGTETIVGMKRDTQFGIVALFGTGGSLTELAKDIEFRVLPLSKSEIEETIQSTKIWASIKKFESEKSLKQISDIITNLHKLMKDHENFSEIDLNPVFVNGNKAYVVDVRIISNEAK